MRAAPRSATIASMHPAPLLRIGLEIHSRDPLRGLLFTDDHRVSEFQGWLQLLAALSGRTSTDADDQTAGSFPIATPQGGEMTGSTLRFRRLLMLVALSALALPAVASAGVPAGATWTEAYFASGDGVRLHADVLRPSRLPRTPARR